MIREFREDDAVEISDFIIEVHRTLLKDYYSNEVIESFCKYNSPEKIRKYSKERRFFVAENEGCLIGIIGIKNKNEVSKFFVHPSYHNQGIGKKLFEKVKQELIDEGHKTITTHSTIYAEPIYKALGFKKIKDIVQVYDRLKINEVLMEYKVK
jgi:GNAT superfamily N-acetyltransferase|tara:strand:- start:281 stop:739 length:459 start_codon:yes stop_codon:yes gene_type:complete